MTILLVCNADYTNARTYVWYTNMIVGEWTVKKRGRAEVGVRVCCMRFLWLRVPLHDACITHGMPPSLSTLPNTLMLLPILTRRFLTASRKCAAIFGVNDDDGGRRIGGGGFNNAGVIQDTLDKIRRLRDDDER